MQFDEVLTHVVELLQRQGRVAYRALKLRFQLDDEFLAGLKDELIDAQRVAIDEDGKVLVWVGGAKIGESENRRIGELKELQEPGSGRIGEAATAPRPPVTYTPTHLADRIRAVAITGDERKTITALFADLKGSTALIEGLDPEEARAVIDPALQLMMDAVHQYDGFVAQALGDGIFALFGAPIAHEDHPQRALYAALRMQDAMRRYADTLRQKGYPPLLMRVGLNTGEVVLRSIRKDDLHADYVPVGHSTNLAARMEQLATPGSIVVSAYTHRLTDGYFVFKDLGATQIKGVEEPLHIYEALGVGQFRTRLQVSASRYGLTRFVGRQSELEQLTKALEQAKAGHGQIVGTVGEPGLGKSRLFYEFKLLSLGGCLVLEAYSVSHGKATAYLPVIELLKSYFEIKAEDDERKRREKVGGKVLMLDRSLEDTLPYLFALLGIEEQPSPLAQMDAQIRRRRTFEALKKLFLRESLNQPLVLIFEDLHWIDGETQGFLEVLSESVASAKLLLLTNYRPEYRHEWGQKTYYTQLRLAPFGRAEAEEFLDSLLSATGSPLPRGERDRVRVSDNNLQALKQLILDKTQGTPFFMEEIVQELVEQGVLIRDAVGAGLVPAHGGRPQGTPLQIPTTVQGVLAARIDRLALDEKALLQQLAVIGRQFLVSLIRQVLTQPEADLYRLLASLQHKEFLYEQPAFPESEYLFKHALTQEVAYNSVLSERRKVLHEQTGQAIEQLYTEKLGEHYSELAHHYSCSGNAEKAIEYLQLAGQQAVQRSANEEAVRFLSAALNLLRTQPDSPEGASRELRLLTVLGPPLIAVRGFTAPEVEQVYSRARQLCQQSGGNAELVAILWGQWLSYFVRADYRNGREIAEQCLQTAETLHDPSLLLSFRLGLGATLFCCGELSMARQHLQQARVLEDPAQHQSSTLTFGFAPGILWRCWASYTLWFLGYPDQAWRLAQEALTLAQQLAHPQTLANAIATVATLGSRSGESQVVLDQANALLGLSDAHGLVYWVALGQVFQGWALMKHEHMAVGRSQLLSGLEKLQTTGAELLHPHYLGLLAEGYLQSDQLTEAVQVVEQALHFVEKNGERVEEAELYRLKGELLLMRAAKLKNYSNFQ